MINLLWFNLRMRLIDWCNKPEVSTSLGWDLVERLGKIANITR